MRFRKAEVVGQKDAYLQRYANVSVVPNSSARDELGLDQSNRKASSFDKGGNAPVEVLAASHEFAFEETQDLIR
jgi:hypothetical protein